MPNVLRCLVSVLVGGSIAVSALAATKDPPLPEPDPTRGSIALSVRRAGLKGLLGLANKIVEQTAVVVFFVKLEDGQEAYDALDLIPSNYSSRKQVYLLNAEPGRYVAVAAGLGGTQGTAVLDSQQIGTFGSGGTISAGVGLSFSTQENAFFSKAMISDTEVTVGPQEMVFVGEYVSKMHTKMKRADEAQKHYYRVLLPGVALKSNFIRNLEGQSVYAADLESVARDPATEQGFWMLARDKVFKNLPSWRSRIEGQLEVLSAGDDPTVGEGAFGLLAHSSRPCGSASLRP